MLAHLSPSQQPTRAVTGMDHASLSPSAPDQDLDSRAYARFINLTNAPIEQAKFFLEAAGGNADRAVSLYYGMLVLRTANCAPACVRSLVCGCLPAGFPCSGMR